MKRVVKLVVKMAAIIILTTTHGAAWAMETNNIVGNAANFLAQPWPWIPLIVTAIIILAGPFNYKNDFTVRMKKRPVAKKK